MDLIEQIEEVLREEKRPLHVNDIADKLIKLYPHIQIPREKLPDKISSRLSTSVKKKNSIFSKVKNKQGGYKRGIYRLKRVQMKKIAFKIPEQPKLSTQYTGSAGEHAVLSELLFFGFNASIMTVDDGIDLVASKDNNYFHIQVKTANVSSKDTYSFSLQRKSFESKSSMSMFYIFVMRRLENIRYVSDFIVFSNSDLRRLIESGKIKKSDKMGIKIEIDRNLKYILNNSEDVTGFLNRFDTIN